MHGLRARPRYMKCPYHFAARPRESNTTTIYGQCRHSWTFGGFRFSEEIHDHAWEFNTKGIAETLSATGKGPTESLLGSAHGDLNSKLEDVRLARDRIGAGVAPSC